jgi:hypothetical protein
LPACAWVAGPTATGANAPSAATNAAAVRNRRRGVWARDGAAGRRSIFRR